MGHKEHKSEAGEKLPSVTQVLGVIGKPGLMFWYGKYGTKECERIKRESADFGHAVHDAIHEFLKRGYILDKLETPKGVQLLTDRQKELVTMFARWTEESRFVPLELELALKDDGLGYGGTFDALGKFGDSNELFVLDWKTSNSVHDDYALQLSAYSQLYNTKKLILPPHKDAVLHGGVVRMSKDPNAEVQFEVKTANNLHNLYPVFGQALELYKFVNKKGVWGDYNVWR